MKTLLTTLLLTSIMLSATAQSISRQVVATSGATLSNATHQLTSTVGESVVGLKTATVSINQGFLAGATNNTVLSVDQQITSKVIKIYPNPISDFVHIDIAKNTKNVTATIYSILGKQVATKKINSTTQTLNISHLETGVYLMQLHFKDTNISKSFKIIKN